jgi:hypothetical protein
MDVQLITSSVLGLPSSQRVDAIVYDGTTDLRLWPPPGPDRDLLEHYGPELSTVLDRERERLDGGALAIGDMIRLHRGKLHCDFLLWIASRGPEDRGVQAAAPSAETLTKAVHDALVFVSTRHVKRVAFGPLGAGPGELDEAARLVLVARAANGYYDECFKAGRPAHIEEVLVCHPFSSRISAARRELGRTVKLVADEPKPAAAAAEPKKKRRAAATGAKRASPRSKKPVLSADDVAQARASAPAYDRARMYGQGTWLVHSKFGVGQVQEITPEGFIVVLFEGGDSRRLLHGRP